VDEIIIVSDNSTDATGKICLEYTDKIFIKDLDGNYAAQRNYSLSKAKGDWILHIDSDEWLPVKTQKMIRKIVEQKRGFDAITLIEKPICYSKYAGSRWMRYGSFYHRPPFIRIFKNKEDIKYESLIFEYLININKSRILSSGLYFNHKKSHYSPVFISKNADWIDDAKIEGKSIGKTRKTEAMILAVTIGFKVFINDFIIKKGFLDGYLGLKLALVFASEKSMRHIFSARDKKN
jgi:glycosyltransferase involved in cell wall biosynthesis